MTVTPLRARRALAAAALAATAALAGCDEAPSAPTTPEPPTPTARWSDPASWPGGAVPAAGADVTVPAGTELLLDASPPPLGNLVVEGTLVADRRDLTLTASRINVKGVFRAGTETQPFENRLTITLTGTRDQDATYGLTTNALSVSAGGTLDLHGESRLGWTRLSATAAAGATRLTLARTMGWRAGDRVVLTSTDLEPTQYDEAVVQAVDGRTVTLAQPLKYAHWGETQTVAGRTLDERAEVGLLSRNIVFRGDTTCAASGFCAHIIAFKGATMRVEGVELYLVGQKFVLARYPIHWHMAQDVDGQYARNNSIHRTFNRCVTVHGTHAATVERNVCHDHLGHGYFLEDGVEQRNTIAENLGVLARVPASGERLLASDGTPASFWVTNPANAVRGNVAAGSSGWGFWLAFPEHPTGMSTTDAVWPRRTPLGEFADNIAHSNRSGALNVDNGPRPDGTTETTFYAPRENPAAESPAVPAEFRNFTAYKHRGRAVWLRGRSAALVSPVLADNGIGATFASSDTYMKDALLVGESANSGGTAFPTGFPVRGFEYYDGTVGAEGATFVNYQTTARGPAGAFGFNRSNAFPLSPLNFASGARFENANRAYIEDPKADKDGDKAAVFLDRDGSVTGTAGRYVVANVPLLLDGSCARRAEWNASVCAGGYGRLGLSSATTGEVVAPAEAARDDGVTLALAGSGGSLTSLNLAVPLGRAYTLRTPAAVTKPRLGLYGVKAGDWVRVSLPFSATALTAWRDYWTGNKVTAAASLAELDASNGDKYYLANGTLHLKLVVQAGRDYAVMYVDPQ